MRKSGNPNFNRRFVSYYMNEYLEFSKYNDRDNYHYQDIIKLH